MVQDVYFSLHTVIIKPRHEISNNVAFWQVYESDEPMQPPFNFRHSNWCSVSSITVIEYLRGQQRLWSVCLYAQADLILCWLHVPHCWKSGVTAHIFLRHYLSILRIHFSICQLFISLVFNTVNVLKFWTLVAYQKGLNKQCRPLSNWSSLIRVFPVCYSGILWVPAL